MVNNKVIVKEKDVWSDLANFIGEMVAKYAEAMDLDNLPDPNYYLFKKACKVSAKRLFPKQYWGLLGCKIAA